MTNGSSVTLPVTAGTITITISSTSQGNKNDTLTWSGIQVRPTVGSTTSGTTGNILDKGTAPINGLTLTNANWGTLTEVAGAAVSLAVSGFPSPISAGVQGSATVTAFDAFGNIATAYSGTIKI